jgi:hypothetical protein
MHTRQALWPKRPLTPAENKPKQQAHAPTLGLANGSATQVTGVDTLNEVTSLVAVPASTPVRGCALAEPTTITSD